MRVCCGSCKTWYRASTGQPLAPGERIVAQCPRCGSDMLLAGRLGDEPDGEATPMTASPGFTTQPVVLEEDEAGGLELLEHEDELGEGRAITERVTEAAFAAVAAADAEAAAMATPALVEAEVGETRDTVPAAIPVVAAAASAAVAVATAAAPAAKDHHHAAGGKAGKKRKDKGRKHHPPQAASIHDTAPVAAAQGPAHPPALAADVEQATATPTEPVDTLSQALEPELPPELLDAELPPDLIDAELPPIPQDAELPPVPGDALAAESVAATTDGNSAPATEAWPEDEGGPVLSSGSITAKTPSPFGSMATGLPEVTPAASAPEQPASPVSPVVAAAAASSAAPVATPKVFTHPRILPVPVGPKPRATPPGRGSDGRTGASAGAVAKGSPEMGKVWKGVGLAAALAVAAAVALWQLPSNSLPVASPEPTVAQNAPSAPEVVAAPAVAPAAEPAPAPAAAPVAAPAAIAAAAAPAPAPAAAAEPAQAAPAAAPSAPAAAASEPVAAEAKPAAAKPVETKPAEAKAGGEAKPSETKAAKAEAAGKKAAATAEPVEPAAPSKAAGPAPEPAPAGPSGLDSDVVEAGLLRMKAGVRMCARAEERRNPEAALTSATLAITVAPSGDITAVTMTGVVASSELGQCIRAAVERVTFPRFDGKPQTIKQTFNLAK